MIKSFQTYSEAIKHKQKAEELYFARQLFIWSLVKCILYYINKEFYLDEN